MYVIIVYDVAEKRVAKMCKFLRRYLTWRQNSVFEGELSEGKLQSVKVGIKGVINAEEDTVLVYSISNPKWLVSELIGVEKNPPDNLI